MTPLPTAATVRNADLRRNPERATCRVAASAAGFRRIESAGSVAGFSLLELIVALAVLTVALLGVARVLGDATGYAAAARRSRLALEAASAAAVALGDGGPLPGLVDSSCAREIQTLGVAGDAWFRLEAVCGGEAGRRLPGDRLRLLVRR